MSFSTWLLKIDWRLYIETVPGGTDDYVEIPNSMCLNSNSAVLNFVYDNLESRYFDFE